MSPSSAAQVTGTAARTLSRRELTNWRNAVYVIFALSGVVMASWISRLPAIRDSLDASTMQMGGVVFGLAAGSMIGLTLAGQAIARIGSKASIASSAAAIGAGLAIAGVGATLGVLPVVVTGLAVLGFGFGLCDVAMNVEGAANERALGRTVMPLFHAAFSVGTIAGAAVGAGAEHWGVPVVVHLSIVGAVTVLGVLAVVRYLQPDPFAQQGRAGGRRGGRRERLAIWRDRRTVLIGLIVLGMAFAEGSANDWLALAMVDGHGVDNTTGALVFALFVTAMTVGRIAGVFVLDRFGRVPVLRVSAVLAAVGLLTVIVSPSSGPAICGVVLWGLGSALGFPVGMSAAADDPQSAAARVSAVATIGYLAFLAGPPLIGFLGEHVGLLNALLVVLVLIVVAALVAPAARELPRRPEHLAASGHGEDGQGGSA